MTDKNLQIINKEQEILKKEQQDLIQIIVANCTNLRFDPSSLTVDTLEVARDKGFVKTEFTTMVNLVTLIFTKWKVLNYEI